MTSIEWLETQNKIILELLLIDKISQDTFEQLNNCLKINMQQAREKYEEEMIGMYVEGGFAKIRFLNGSPYIDARQYYQETFKKD